MTAINALRGLLHGAGSASLLDIHEQPCTATALKVNNLLLSSAQTLCALGNPINTAVLMVTSACALVPAMVADTHNLISFSDSVMKQIDVVYETGIVVNVVAMLALGNTTYALASLSVIALNAVATGQIKHILDGVKKACGAISLAIFGAYVFSSKETLANVASFSVILLGIRAILNAVQPSLKEVQQSESIAHIEEPIVQKQKPVSKKDLILKEALALKEEVATLKPAVPEEHWLFKPMFS